VGRLRRDAARAGEAMLLLGLAVTLGVVWYGGGNPPPPFPPPPPPPPPLPLPRARPPPRPRGRPRPPPPAGGGPFPPRARPPAPARGARAPDAGGGGAGRGVLRFPSREVSPKRLPFRLLPPPAPHLRGPGSHRGPAVQRSLPAVHPGRGSLLEAGLRGPGRSR